MHIAPHPHVPDGLAIYLDAAQRPIETVVWPNPIGFCRREVAFILLSPDDYADFLAWIYWREAEIELPGATIH